MSAAFWKAILLFFCILVSYTCLYFTIESANKTKEDKEDYLWRIVSLLMTAFFWSLFYFLA